MQSETYFGTLAIKITISIALILFLGCSGSGGGGGEVNDSQTIDLTDYDGPPSFDLALEDETTVSKTIYANVGGQITAEGSFKITLDIPPNALNEDTNISLSLFSSSNSENYALGGVFGPDGLTLNEPGTLSIFFDPPLLPNQVLYVLEEESGNINTSYDTGLIVTASDDGSNVELPLEHFSSQAIGTEFVCHTHTNIRIIEWLLKKKITQQQIKDEVIKNYKNELISALKNLNVAPETFVEESIDSLVNNQNMRKGYSQVLLKGLLKSYFVKTSIEANVENNTATPTTTDCRNQLKQITENGDVAVVLFGSNFSDDPLTDKIPHSGATNKNQDEQNNGIEVPVIENATSVGQPVGDAWEKALAERKKQYQSQDEIPRVIPVRIEDIDKFRNTTPVNSVNQYLRDHLNITDSNILLNGGKKPVTDRKTWGSARFYVPRDDLLSKTLYSDLADEICPYEDPLYADDIDHDGDYYSANQGDCDDLYDSVHPGAIEVCDDFMDNDCNGAVDCDDSACAENSACNPCADDSSFYVWYVENLALKDVFVSSCVGYHSEDALCSYQGGGLDCSIMAEKVLLGSGYVTSDEAVSATCATVDNIRPCGSTWFCGWLGDIGGVRHVIDGLGACQ